VLIDDSINIKSLTASSKGSTSCVPANSDRGLEFEWTQDKPHAGDESHDATHEDAVTKDEASDAASLHDVNALQDALHEHDAPAHIRSLSRWLLTVPNVMTYARVVLQGIAGVLEI
jgi:hypothetical protein